MATTSPTSAVETDRPLHESFDNGIGVFTDNWNVDASVPGQVTLRGTSGLMQQAVSTSSGQGYGTYTINAKFEGTMPGPAIILWPGDNHWPGQEINLAEVTNDGTGRIYGALHWDDNGDHAVTDIYEGVLTGVFHEFKLIWEPNHLTYLVDGVKQAEFTQYVPIDYDHGGMNNVIGWLNTSYETSMTVTDVDYVPLGVAGTPVAQLPATDPTPSPAPAPSTPTPTVPVAAPAAAIDWDALAAQAAANFAATGHWYYDMPAAEGTAATPQPAQPAAPAEAPVDWYALAAQAEANYAATGHWFY
ncbi:family 16 glycosylhydrolase [Paeniroseomonas aquatica]|uniref:Family 16 glycosylhydrolase n=1 Tax=Paeniroseomonas aquatica TaxID=373043 RepID=A0ABT8ACI4_9PROT|nr:family 16 glycosylhydrolase [Paeniroseomonas aquatica]MDN3567044.1 family 16 glycosylhydrolase [Paeniroseomonas aquatica]